MIHAIEINNFQSHAHSKLEFHPGINSIIGASNKGKSAILRAIYWAVYNRPAGESVVSHWAMENDKQIAETSATIIKSLPRGSDKEGNCVISRIRSAEKNSYSLDGIMYNAIKMDVPEPVQAAFNIGEVNIQKQMDAPFLLSESSADIARFFNKLIRLEDIDAALSKIESKRRATKQTIEDSKDNITRLSNELSAYSNLSDIESLAKKYETLEASGIKRTHSIITVRGIIAQYNEILVQKAHSDAILNIDPVLTELETVQKAYENKRSIQKTVQSLVSSLKEFKKKEKDCAKISGITPLLDSWERKEEMRISKMSTNSDLKKMILQAKNSENLLKTSNKLTEVEPLLSKLDRFSERMETIKKNTRSIREFLSEIRKNTEFLNGLDDSIEKLVKSLPKVCPTCGGPLKV